jgi:transcriptional regulator with GAF, ATPase, and Fis domain
VFDIVDKVAASDSTAMIFGESGTGKELIARALHQNSERKDKPFVAVNCGAIPQELLESELFGYEKGAFTGASQTRIGRLELANEGTIFLDEIGDMPVALQVKLLRVLAEREIDRLGGTKSVKIDVRFITATHRNLEEAIKDGNFREDLYYRLNIIPIVVPPLRDRKSDIPLLVQHFLTHSFVIDGLRIFFLIPTALG